MYNWTDLASLFTLGFSSLFPLVNPVGTALIIEPFFSQSSASDRRAHARTICLYVFVLGFCALLLGSWVLRFMGISVATTQFGGGLIIARMGLQMLGEDVEKKTAPDPGGLRSSLFYPLTFPLTLGPGGISALVTLSAHAHGADMAETLIRQGTLATSLLAVVVVTYFCFVYSRSVIGRIGPQGSLVLNRLMAFLVFCIGLQVAVGGLTHLFPRILN